MTWTIYTNFCSPFPRRRHVKFGFDWPGGFRGEDVRNCGRTTDGWTPEHGYTISSPCEPNGSGELKIQAPSHLLWLYSPVCIGPVRKPEDRVVHVAAQFIFSRLRSCSVHVQHLSHYVDTSICHIMWTPAFVTLREHQHLSHYVVTSILQQLFLAAQLMRECFRRKK